MSTFILEINLSIAALFGAKIVVLGGEGPFQPGFHRTETRVLSKARLALAVSSISASFLYSGFKTISTKSKWEKDGSNRMKLYYGLGVECPSPVITFT